MGESLLFLFQCLVWLLGDDNIQVEGRAWYFGVMSYMKINRQKQ